MPSKTILFRIAPDTGLGHILTTLLNLAFAANATGRRLAVDARLFPYFDRDRHARFHDCFKLIAPPTLECVTDLAQIEKIAADQNTRVIGTGPAFKEAMASSASVLTVFTAAVFQVYRLGDKTLPPAFQIVASGWLGERLTNTLRVFQDGTPTVGVYFRHGNGEFLGGRFDKAVFVDHSAHLARLAQNYVDRAREIAQQRNFSSPRFFVACDNAEFAASVRERLPRAFSLACNLPQQDWKQHVKQSGHSENVLFEAAQDIWALSSCTALLRCLSLFADFAALNSKLLSHRDVVDIGAPHLLRLVEMLPASEAVSRARAAYDVAPNAITSKALKLALERVGDHAGAATIKRRMQWWDVGIASCKEYVEAKLDAREGRRKVAIARLLQLEISEAPNPYRLRQVALWQVEEGERHAAIRTLKDAVSVDPGIKQVNELLSKLLSP